MKSGNKFFNPIIELHSYVLNLLAGPTGNASSRSCESNDDAITTGQHHASQDSSRSHVPTTYYVRIRPTYSIYGLDFSNRVVKRMNDTNLD